MKSFFGSTGGLFPVINGTLFAILGCLALVALGQGDSVERVWRVAAFISLAYFGFFLCTNLVNGLEMLAAIAIVAAGYIGTYIVPVPAVTIILAATLATVALFAWLLYGAHPLSDPAKRMFITFPSFSLVPLLASRTGVPAACLYGVVVILLQAGVAGWMHANSSQASLKKAAG